MKKAEACFAGVLALLGALALAGVVHLAFVFPRTMAIWEDEGRTLSAAEQTLARLSGMCQTSGLFIMPALLLCVIGCGAWAALTARRSKQGTAGN